MHILCYLFNLVLNHRVRVEIISSIICKVKLLLLVRSIRGMRLHRFFNSIITLRKHIRWIVVLLGNIILLLRCSRIHTISSIRKWLLIGLVFGTQYLMLHWHLKNFILWLGIVSFILLNLVIMFCNSLWMIIIILSLLSLQLVMWNCSCWSCLIKSFFTIVISCERVSYIVIYHFLLM